MSLRNSIRAIVVMAVAIGVSSHANAQIAVTTCPLVAPLALSPAPSATNVPLTTTLQWTSTDLVDHFDVYVTPLGQCSTASAPTGSTPPGSAIIGTNSFTPPALQPGTDYEWKVVPVIKNLNGGTTICNSSTSMFMSCTKFTTATPAACTPPAAPALLTPVRDDVLTQTPQFTWSAAAGAGSYIIHIEQPGVTGGTTITDTARTTSYTPATALPVGSYAWFVEAVAACDTTLRTPATPPSPFAIGICPMPAPSALSPDNRTVVAPGPITLSWAPIAGARYDVSALIDDSTALTPIATQIASNNAVFALGAGHKAQWRVSASVKGCATGTLTTQATFLTTCPTVGPSTVNPPPGASIPSGPVTLTWAPVPDALSYDVYRVDAAGKTQLGHALPVNTFQYNAAPGESVTWYASANYGACSVDGPVATFTAHAATTCGTTPPVITSIGPGTGPFDVGSTLTLTWTPVTGAIGYDVLVSNDGGVTFTTSSFPPAPTSASHTVNVAGAYLIEVRANFGANCPPLTSAPIAIVVKPATSTCGTVAPTLLGPDPTAQLDDKNPVTLTWTAVDGAISYDVVLVSASSSTRIPIPTVPASAAPSATVKLDAGTYGWTVLANFANCPPIASQPRTFVVGGSAACPTDIATLTTPANNTTVTLPVTFGWSAVPNAVAYAVFAVGSTSATPVALGSTSLTQLTVTDGLAAGTYQWYVQAFFGTACNSTQSSRSSFTVAVAQNCPTTAATLVSPANGATGVPQPATFNWNAVTGATGYHLIVAINGGSATPIAATTNSQFSTTLPAGSVEWYVETVFPNDCPSTQSQHFHFTTTDASGCPANPQSPQTLAPADGANVSSPVTFQWTAVTGATSYRVVATIDNASGFDVGTTTTTQLTATLPQGNVSWAVVALFGTDCPSTVSKRASFKVTSATQCGNNRPATLVSPANNASLKSPITFSWSAVSGATGYKLFVGARDSSGGGNNFDLLGTTTDTQLQRVMSAGSYEWYVETAFAGCDSQKSSSSRFSVADQVTCGDATITLAAPANGATVTSPVSFSWSAVAGATNYRLWLSVGGSAFDIVTKVATTSTQPLSVPSGSVEWYVEALRDGCPSVLSPHSKFTVQKAANCDANGAPTLVSPTGTASESVDFKWNGVSGATGYRIWLASSGQPFADIATTPDTHLQRDLTAGNYSWFVEAFFQACPSTKSATATFTIQSSTPACSNANPSIVAPIDGSPSVGSPVTFLWSSVTGADDYRVFASIDDGAQTLIGETHDTTISRPLPPGRVKWFVEATFEHCSSTKSPTATFTIAKATSCSGDAAQLVAPAEGTTNASNPVAFAWNPVSGSSGYVLWVKSDEGTATALAQTTDTSISKHLPEGDIEWWIVTFGAGCPPTESNHAHFTIPKTACDNRRPILVAPGDDLQVTSPVTLVWTSVAGAKQYKVWTEATDGDSLLATTTATTLTTPLPTGPTRWFVEAIFDTCSPTQSATSDFRVIQVPTCATPAKPLTQVAGEVASGTGYNVHWTAVANADKYELQESTTADFAAATTVVVSGVSWPANHQTTGAPSQYLYRVRAISNCNDDRGAYSDVVGVFVIPPKPTATQQNASAEVGTASQVVQTIFLPGTSTPTTFNARADKPWLTVTPSSGTLTPLGVTLTVTSDPSALALGTNTGTIVVTYSTSPANGGASVNGTTPPSTVPISVSLVTPVGTGGKTSPLPESLFIPAVGHATGANNSLFQSDLRVANTSPQIMKYLLNFTPSGTDGTKSSSSTTIQISPGATMALDDILASFFGASAAGGSSIGTLEIRPLTSTAATSAFAPPTNGLGVSLVTVASSRTYNATPDGTYGQFVPAIPFAQFIGSTANSILSFQQLAQSNAFRTNFGLVEGAGEPATVLLSVFDGSNNKIGEFTQDLQPGEHRQINSILAANGINNVSDVRIELKVTSSTGRVTGYASVVDNTTNDPLLVYPVLKSAVTSKRYTVPGIGDFDSGFAHWKSDVRLFNAATTPANVTLSYYPQGDPAHPQSIALTLAAGETRALDDFIHNNFPMTQTAGSLVVTSAADTSVIATARTYTDTGNGTYGQFIAGVTPADSVGFGGRSLQLLQLEDSSRMRTNISVAETSGSAATALISIVLPDSRVTPTVSISLAPNEFKQIPLAGLGLGSVYNVRASVRVVSGSGKVTAAASVIDQVTQDPTFVPAQ